MISLAHGIGLGWLSPMLPKLQSSTDTPIDFTVNVDESSWIGALISVGGVIGNISFLLIFDRWGLNKRSLFAICSGVVLMLLNMFCGSFALVNYMSSIFAAIKSELHPDINTIIVGVVQVIGTYTATILVDRYGRKVLMIVSTSGMGIGLAAFGIYAFFAEETDVDLSVYSHWLPLLLMGFIIFIANVGILSVTVVVLVEILPTKIRSIASSFCLALLSLFAFIVLRIFPLSMHYFGLSATMWFCATVCAFGLFYISLFLEETKGKSMDAN
ncbi:facilitated trehalose transporter Tret1-like [Musca vetustissima]|uniref:facilitated trehalose transporter Tret1-like n=1 Tax=Musca vetustissima TaxID=27455 RepID=UPI002AB6D4AE|nr:facilitated trehalose transporter Tret1-like [Musca vetustissima]